MESSSDSVERGQAVGSQKGLFSFEMERPAF